MVPNLKNGSVQLALLSADHIYSIVSDSGATHRVESDHLWGRILRCLGFPEYSDDSRLLHSNKNISVGLSTLCNFFLVK